MLRTTEWDLHELLRNLFERLVQEVQEEYESFGDFLDLVREEEAVTLWLGDEDSRGRGARFEARVRLDSSAEDMIYELVVDGVGVELFRTEIATVPATAGEWVSAMGLLRKDGVRQLFDRMVQTGALDRFFYSVRITSPAQDN